MPEIKYIHCFGTSHTAGGGFEFESIQKPELKHLYKECGEELNQFNFSWPGILQKYLNQTNIKILNHAKSGFGNELMYRKVYDIITSNEFKREENLFIFEFSFSGRAEYYLNSINDYVVFNYGDVDILETEENKKFINIGHNYFYDEINETRLNKLKNTLIKLFRKTKNRNIIEKDIERNNTFFYSFINQLKINYLFLQPPFPAETLDSNLKNLLFNDFEERVIRINDGKTNFLNVLDFIHNSKSKYTITTETNKKILDNHLGLLGNRIIASNIYNNLIKNKYISETPIDILNVLENKIKINNLI